MRRIKLYLLIISTLISFSMLSGGSVLQLIPDSSVGFVRVKSLKGLSDNLKELVSQMTPMGTEPGGDPLAALLRRSFGGKYQSVSDLERLGFDVKGDFAVVFTTPDLKEFFVLIGIADRAKLEASLAALIPNPQADIYSGAKHYRSSEGCYTILHNIFVFSNDFEGLRAAIDLYSHRSKPILENAEYQSLSLSMDDDVAAFIKVADIMGIYGALIEQLPRQIEQSGGSNHAASLLRAQGRMAADMMGQIQLLGMNLEIEGVKVRIDSAVRFKSGSELADLSGGKPVKLDEFSNLPPYQVCGVGDLKGIFMLTREKMKDQIQVDEETEKLVSDFWAGVGDMISFALNISGPPFYEGIQVFKVVDPEKVRRYLDSSPRLIGKLNGMLPGQRMPFEVESVEQGETELYKGVEIKSLKVKYKVTPETAPQGGGIQLPPEIKILYATKGDRLIIAGSISSNPIHDVLDAMEGGSSAADMDGFYETTGELLPKPTTVVLISPQGIIKSILKSISASQPNAAATYMLIQNVPERYSMAISKSGTDERGVARGRMSLSLEDIKQITSISGGGTR